MLEELLDRDDSGMAMAHATKANALRRRVSQLAVTGSGAGRPARWPCRQTAPSGSGNSQQRELVIRRIP